jgi:hypothetical protein
MGTDTPTVMSLLRMRGLRDTLYRGCIAALITVEKALTRHSRSETMRLSPGGGITIPYRTAKGNNRVPNLASLDMFDRVNMNRGWR